MSAERCKEVIDAAALIAGLMLCVSSSVALNGAQGREPSQEQVKRFSSRAERLTKISQEILEGLNG